MLAIHKTYEGELGEKKEVLFVSDGKATKKIKGAATAKYIGTLKPGIEIVLTSSNPKDNLVGSLQLRGVITKRAHWHSTGIPKNLPPEEIAKQFALLPAEQLSNIVVNQHLLELSDHVTVRRAILELRKASMLRFKAEMRARGLTKEDDPVPPELQCLVDAILEQKRISETPVDKLLISVASKIPDCSLFNTIADITTGMFTSAYVVSEIGDCTRFPTVASIWHYAGYHVVDGKAPKRARGKNIDWNPKLRTALWSMSDSIIKNRQNRWRDEYDKFKAQYAPKHAERCKCTTGDGHIGAYARRRVVKEILKEFWIACNKGQTQADNHSQVA